MYRQLKNHPKSVENMRKNSLKTILTLNKVYINLTKGNRYEPYIKLQ